MHCRARAEKAVQRVGKCVCKWQVTRTHRPGTDGIPRRRAGTAYGGVGLCVADGVYMQSAAVRIELGEDTQWMRGVQGDEGGCMRAHATFTERGLRGS